MNLYDLTRPRLAELIASWGGRPVHAGRLWKYLYREDVGEFEAMPDLPGRLRARLQSEMRIAPLAQTREICSDDGLTRKYLLRLDDGRHVETVLMRFDGRVTACLSSQVGCALGCVFCATGQIGFTRNLSTGEIVAQALHVDRLLRSMAADDAHGQQADAPARRGSRRSRRDSLGNIVLMGMGEPLLNYDAVMGAIEILCDPSGLAIGAKQLTLSTVGVADGIIRLADEARPFSLAVSLHAATQQERAAMIPAAPAWPLDSLMEACRYYAVRLHAAGLGRKIFFEWTLIEGKNDSANHAHALARLTQGIPAQINLIPLNPTLGYAGATGHRDSVLRFRSILRDYGLPVSVRQRRGIDIAAGCGQLAGNNSETFAVVGVGT